MTHQLAEIVGVTGRFRWVCTCGRESAVLWMTVGTCLLGHETHADAAALGREHLFTEAGESCR